MERNTLFAKQGFDIQPLSLENFPQTPQAFYLNLANTFTRQANFTPDLF